MPVGIVRPRWPAASTWCSAPAALLADVNAANVAVGLTCAMRQTASSIPLQLAVMAKLHVAGPAAASWLCAVWLTAGLTTLAFTLRYRQPICFGQAVPVLVLLGTVGVGYTLPEIVGASLLTGVIILALGHLGVGERVLRWFPLPVVMGMFGGSILSFVTGAFAQLATQPLVVGSALVGYLGAAALRRAWLPPIAGALLAGLGAALPGGQVAVGALRWDYPTLVPVWPAFNPSSLVTVTLPLVAVILGVGHVQTLGILLSQGYQPPIRRLTLTVGANTLINALFGGHPAYLGGIFTGFVASDEAGPHHQRYVGGAIAGLAAVAIALNASSATTLLAALPGGLVAALAGLAVLGVLTDAVRTAVAGEQPLAGMVAFAIAASPFQALGLPPAFWALLGGWLMSLVAERSTLDATR